MNNEKKYTERDIVLAKREGFMRAYMWSRVAYALHHEAQDAANNYFPLPKVTRPRVVKDPHDDGSWYVKSGDVLWTTHATAIGGTQVGFDYQRASLVRKSPERVAIWADLLANPTEEVEDA